MQRLGYIPILPAHPQKENRLILKGWGVKLRVLGWIFWGFEDIIIFSIIPTCILLYYIGSSKF